MDRGEFEAAPQVAAPVKKGGKGATVLAILFALIAAGLGVWLAIVLLNPAKGGESGGKTANGGSGGNAVAALNEDEEVQKLLDEIEESFQAGYSIDKTYSDSGLPIKVNDKLWAASVRSYGAYIEKYADSDGSAKQMRDEAVSVLKKNGFTNTTVPNFGYYGDETPANDTTHYFKNGKGLYCNVTGVSDVAGNANHSGYSWFTYECTNENWLTEDNKKLAIDLAAAYDSTEEGKEYPLTYISDTLTRKIEKNEAGAYEHITVGLEDAVGLFYRKVGGEWKFFTGTQQAISCSQYNTAELKEAYKGEKCWDDATNKFKSL
jgi:hypothetical protein